MGVSADGSHLVYSALYPSDTVAESVAVDSSGVVHVGGSAGFVSAVSPGAPAATEIFGFQNAFGGSLTAQISPGELIAVYGPAIGPATAVAATPLNGFYPTTLGGVQVAVDGVNVPLLYVSANQINAVAPEGACEQRGGDRPGDEWRDGQCELSGVSDAGRLRWRAPWC